MNISRENTGDLTAIIKLQIVEADYAENVKKALNDLKKKAHVPGFRQGKVPSGMIMKMYGPSVLADEVNKLLTDSLNNYVTEEKLNILGNPVPVDDHEKIDFNVQKDFTFNFEIGFSPEINLEINKDIEVKFHKIEVSDSMVDDYIKDIQERFGEHTHPETISATSKVTAVFTQLNEDGTALEGGIKSDHASFEMEAVKDKAIHGDLMGKKVGDALTFDPMKALKDANKVAAMLQVAKVMVEDLKASFSVEIKEITEITPAELNEDLFNKTYPSADLKSEEDLRNRVREDAEKQFESESDKLFMSNAVDTIIEKAHLQLPDSFLKKWILEQNEGKLTAEQLDVQYDSYANTLKWQLIQNKIIVKHDIKVSEEEIRNHVKSFISGQYFGGMEMNETFENSLNAITDNVMKNKEEVNKIYDQLYDDKILKLLKENLTLKTESLTLDEFIKKASEGSQA